MFKKLIAAVMAISLIMSLFSGLVIADSSALISWTDNGLVRYLQSQTPPVDKKTSINLNAARNEYENGQVVVRSDVQDFTVTGVDFNSLTCGSNVIDATNLEYHFALYYLGVPTNSVGHPGWAADGTPLYPQDETPDPLSNDRSIMVTKSKNQPIYIKVYVPENTSPGTYTGSATVRTSLGDVTVPINVQVFSATVPKIKDAGFTYFNWMSDIAQGYWTDWNVFRTYYNVNDVLPDASDFTTDFYSTINNWAKVMREHRQNMVLINTIAFLDAANSTIDTSGRITFDWTLFDKYVDTWLKNGMTRISGGHFAYNEKDVMLERDSSGNAVLVWKPYSKDLGLDESKDNWYCQYLPALAAHLQQFDITGYPQFAGTGNTKLFDIWYQQLYDEPSNPSLWEYFAKLADRYLVNSNSKRVKLMDADLSGAMRGAPYNSYVDIQVPREDCIPGNESYYSSFQASGKEFWSYVCAEPSKLWTPWLHRFIHEPDTAYPLLFWYDAKLNITGYLDWALNVWNCGMTMDGDNYITYPDISGKDMLSSIRFEGQRDGVEDWELIQIAKSVDAVRTQQILEAAVKDPSGNYIQNANDYYSLRLAMLRIASGEQPSIPVNLALNKSVTSSSVATQYGYANAQVVDGNKDRNVASGWSNNDDSKTADSWVMVDLGETCNISSVNLYWSPYDTYAPAQYQVQVSQDGTNFTTVYTQTSKVTWEVTHAFNPVNDRYVRIYVPMDVNASWPANLLYELEVMGTLVV